MMKEKIDWRIVITAIICITLLEAWAMYNGVNGKLFGIVLVVIAGLAGFAIPSPFKTN